MITALFDHIWQSTAFVCAAGLLTLTLRRQAARIRYWVWLVASLKFLVPFSLLIAVGRWLAPQPQAPVAFSSFAGFATQLATPFVETRALDSGSRGALDVTSLILALWVSGIIVVVSVWVLRWLRLRVVVRAARPFHLAAPFPVKSTAERIEPSLVGIWRPMLLLPEEIPERMAPEELSSIIAHEVCHFHRRDNLTSAIHLVVEAVFWFYPLTWWVGARLLAERERACDEAVVASGHDPQVYAEGILKVCRLYIRAPLASTASVGGANLRKRVEEIMNHSVTFRMGVARRLLLVAVGGIAVAVPVTVGLLSARALDVRAAAEMLSPTPNEIAHGRDEQIRPQKEIPYNPADFDKFVGYYQVGPMIMHVFRDGDRYFSQFTGQPAVEWFPESPDEFFTKRSPIQISFTTGARDNITGLVIHKNGHLVSASRTSAAVALTKDHPSPGTRGKVLGYIEALEKGTQLDYGSMTPQLAGLMRAHSGELQSMTRNAGEFRSLSFKGVAPNGLDIYVASFAQGRIVWLIAPLTTNGKVSNLKAVPVPVPLPLISRRGAAPSPDNEVDGRHGSRSAALTRSALNISYDRL